MPQCGCASDDGFRVPGARGGPWWRAPDCGPGAQAAPSAGAVCLGPDRGQEGSWLRGPQRISGYRPLPARLQPTGRVPAWPRRTPQSPTPAEAPGNSELGSSFLTVWREAFRNSCIIRPPPDPPNQSVVSTRGLSQGCPGVHSLPLGRGVSARVPSRRVCVGFSSRLRDSLLDFPVSAVEMVLCY